MNGKNQMEYMAGLNIVINQKDKQPFESIFVRMFWANLTYDIFFLTSDAL